MSAPWKIHLNLWYWLALPFMTISLTLAEHKHMGLALMAFVCALWMAENSGQLIGKHYAQVKSGS